MRFSVRVTARASRDEIVGARGGRLVVRLSAPPVEGQANEALVAVLARALRVTRGSLRVVAGTRSRLKVVEGPDAAAERLAALMK